MAQRTIHYLFGELFSQQIHLKDKKRFLLGSILPDAYINPQDRDLTHFKVKTEQVNYFDFQCFREQFGELIVRDDLYLGYYMHLVEDAFYRKFFYAGNHLMPRTQAEVAMLHSDYHILNSYIVEKYRLVNVLGPSLDISQEPINHIAAFAVHDFIADMAGDFTEKITAQPRFLTETMLEKFIEQYVPLGLTELKCIQSGHFHLQAQDYAWPRRR